MAQIVKLTYTHNGKATLVNLDQMTSAFRIYEKNSQKYATRINFSTEQFVVVDEELQEVMKLSQGIAQGEFQDSDWVQIDNGTGEDFVERLENDYQRNTNRGGYQHAGGGYRQNNYQPRNNYNRW